MSFLLQDEASLEEALAFIDNCFQYEHTDIEAPISGDLSHPPVVTEAIDGTKDKNGNNNNDFKPQKTKAVKGPNYYRARWQAELRALRVQVQELEKRLQNLRRVHGRPDCVAQLVLNDASDSFSNEKPELASIWIKMALRQYTQRQKSEITNRKLKALLTRQIKLARYLEEALVNHVNMEDHEFLFGQSDRAPRDFFDGNESISYADLERGVERLYLETDNIFDLTDHAARTLELRHDPKHGMVVEMKEVVPLPYSLKESGAAIWGLITGKLIQTSHYHQHSCKPTANSLSKSFSILVEEKSSNVTVHGCTSLRKFVEPDRVIFVWQSVMLLPTDSSVRLHEQGWIIFRKSSSRPDAITISQTCFRVFADVIHSATHSVKQVHKLGSICAMVGRTINAKFDVVQDEVETALLAGVGVSVQ